MQPGGLGAYWKKRDFRATPEPSGRPARARANQARARAGEALSFVVQKHAASRLHYDFRLELGGTLKSWAVPKGPSFDPAVKRMAVHVEDHPLAYADFEGVIPEGHYGAGTVIVWDRGTWVPDGDAAAQYRAGKLKFALKGEKLHGRWTLVRMKGKPGDRQEAWLLIKEKDDAARPEAEFDVVAEMPDSVIGRKTRAAAGKRAPRVSRAKDTPALPDGARRAKLPLALAPQLATLVDAPPAGDWVYEVKFDGYRILARVEGDDIRLLTRNGHDWTAKLPHLKAAIAKLGLASAWLDGEIVILRKNGSTDFQALQNAFDANRPAARADTRYVVFDLPWYDGHDLTSVPLTRRRDLLRGLMAANSSPYLQFSEHFEAPPTELLRAACGMQLEGVIGKRADSVYVSSRSPHWIKLKCTQRQEFVVVGWTDPKGSRTGLGSLLLGVHDAGGKLVYAGSVGSGFNEAMLAGLTRQLKALAAERTALSSVPRGVAGHWVKPKLVAEVSFSEWTGEGRIRHPVFHALRTDKPPRAITREVPKPAASTGARKRPREDAEAAVAGVRVSHPERVIDPTTGLTKWDLVVYYQSVAALILPHLKGRPVSLVRGPAGIKGQLFFQKHADTLRIPGVKELPQSLWPEHAPLIEVASEAALIGAAQMNVIEFHTWNATSRAIMKPDRIVFDLDPGEGVDFRQVVEGTLLTRAMLEELGLDSVCKTSGGKGLHVVVPIAARWDWDTVKDFSQAIVQHLARELPDRFVARSGPKNRVGRIFIDYLRNGFGATTAAAYSARARPGLGISVPVSWDEVPGLTAGNPWTIANAGERLAAAARDDPWEGRGSAKQGIAAAMKRMGPLRR